MQDVEIIAMLKTYISATLSGMGALKGASCQIQSVEAITGGNRITFAWEDNDGVSTTSVLDVMDGSDGDTGVGISGVAIDDNDHLVVTYTDGTTEDAGALPTVSVGVSDLTDVSLTDLADGELLKYNSTTGKWENASGSTVDTSLIDLSDVSVTSVADGQYIKWDASLSRWVNATLADIATSGSWNDLADTPTTLSGYGITDAYTKTETDTLLSAKADSATTLSGYGITDAYTKTEVDTALADKADSSTTLSGYGITDAYTKTETDTLLDGKADSATTLSGYGITDAYTKTEVDTVLADKADSATTLSGYGITDAYTKTETDTLLSAKADSATTLSGYGITDAYTSTETDSAITAAIETLDVTDSAVAGSYVTEVSETDGAISVTREAADNTPTSSSTKMVTSGGVKTALDDKVDWGSNGVLGAKNLLEVLNTTQTINGITFTVNNDGSVTATGTASAATVFTTQAKSAINKYYSEDLINNISGKSIIASGCPSGGSSSTYYVRAWIQNIPSFDEYGEGVVVSVPSDLSSRNFGLLELHIASGITVSNLTFYPMIRLASDTDSTYQPYAKTNQELTAENQTLTNNVDVLFETGVKNICPPYSGSFSSNGITYIGNSDGTVTANGTCSENVGINIRVYLKAGQYKVSGCPSGGSYSTYRIGVTTDSWTLIGTHDHGNGTTITIPSDGYYRINLDVRSGYVANNLVFKPMITDVDTPESDYDHYVPYAKTNHQLTEDSVTWDDYSKLGAVNLLPNNATTQTVNGVTFTVNSNKVITATVPSTITETTALDINTSFTLSAGTYKLHGCPSGIDDGTTTVCRLQLYKTDMVTVVALDNGSGAVFSLASDTALVCKIRLGSGLEAGTYTFYPMLTLASYTGSYVPYVKTNKELTSEISKLTEDVTPTHFDLTVRGDRCTIVAQKNCKIGKQVYIWCRFTSLVSNTDVPVLTVPNGYIPPNIGTDSGVIIHCIPKYANSDRSIYRWAQVFSTGEIDVMGVSQNNDYLIYGSYFID